MIRRKPKVRSGIKRSPERVYHRHRAWIRNHVCAVVICQARITECAHVRTAANSGIGLKPSDAYCIPLCRDHHAEQHQIGQPAFERKYGIDLLALAEELVRRSPDVAMRNALRESHT